MKKKYCKECAEEIHGRKDKQFCSDYCRATNHNNRYEDQYTFIRRINKIIRRNRKILFNLNVQGTTTISKLQLIEAGFEFEFHTSTSHTPLGKTCYFCYDQGYCDLERGNILIISKGKEGSKAHKQLITPLKLKRHQPT
ncbi:MAG TPA: hypothetical protein VGK46_01845 [Saprospiraceae bacterium]